MQVNPVRSPVTVRTPAIAAGDFRNDKGRGRIQLASQPNKNVPAERVIEGELLDKTPGSYAQDIPRRFLPGGASSNASRPENGEVYSRRARAAIGTYLDTAMASGSPGYARSGIDLYA